MINNSDIAIREEDVVISVDHSQLQSEQPCITEVNAEIFVQKKNVGHIEAIIVDRSKIPRGYFLSEMDDYSADTQWIGVVLFEPKMGRTKLKSLVEYDDANGGFLYIKSLSIQPKYRVNDDSNVGAFAIRKLLRNTIVSNKCSTAIYVLDGTEAMTENEKKEYDKYQEASSSREYGREKTTVEKAEENRWKHRIGRELASQDSYQFLRNGFFQDKAYASSDNQARIVVASHHHWEGPLKSHRDVVPITFPAEVPEKSSPDEALLTFVKKKSTPYYVTSIQLEEEGAVESYNQTDAEKVRSDLVDLIDHGASVGRSGALHASIYNNDYKMVNLLLRLDSTAVNAVDDDVGKTPLMVAALSAAGRCNNDGIKDTRVIDLLLQYDKELGGQLRDTTSQDGMTAYGNFVAQQKEYDLAIRTMMGQPPSSGNYPDREPTSVREVKDKLMPTTGPTDSDVNGGEQNPGFVDYSDDEEDFDPLDYYDY